MRQGLCSSVVIFLMKFTLLDDGKLCFEADADDSEESEDSETDGEDFSVKTYFDKITVTE